MPQATNYESHDSRKYSSTLLNSRSISVSDQEKQKLSGTFNKSFTSGIAGSMAMVVQVFSLMWMHTIRNYQYRYGGSMADTLRNLYAEGGIPRFYRGVSLALVHGTCSRFGDTFSNSFLLHLKQSHDSLRNVPVQITTLGASIMTSCFRVLITPLDTIKTIMQVKGKEGLSVLGAKVKTTGVGVMWHGSMATFIATGIGYYPWFLTFNILNERIQDYDDLKLKTLRRAGIGFASSIISDTCSNSFRVIKTIKQTSQNSITYSQAVGIVLKEDGILGVFRRGLKTRITTNGVQSLLFSVLWKFFEDFLQDSKRH
jgi:Mitochondrial carrier protein